MKKFTIMLSVLFLAGCMSKADIEDSEVISDETLSRDVDEAIKPISDKQLKLIEQMPEVDAEEALKNITEMYSYQHLVEKELKQEPAAPLFSEKNAVAEYLAYGFSQFLSGKILAAAFFENYSSYMDDSYLDLFGTNNEMRADTLQAVYDASYKNLPETKIAAVFVSNMIVSKTAKDVYVSYRRHLLEDGTDIFYEMGFESKDDKWVLVDDRRSINPYAEAYWETEISEVKGE